MSDNAGGQEGGRLMTTARHSYLYDGLSFTFTQPSEDKKIKYISYLILLVHIYAHMTNYYNLQDARGGGRGDVKRNQKEAWFAP